ncbi:MAG: phosphopantothenoylcysteine decarboxylase/phosphopantothenate--cysteine ligase [Myxococcota bacterium]|jgi:phosphopantothenoylcysteine decarboxylase/phosphopantothenate--cysteine ligase
MNLLIGVTGGIAAYKACELTSAAIKQGHTVRVVMTRGATQFVGALTFEGLTGHRVMVDTFADAMDHIHWAKWADVVVVAPLTANTLAKLAMGMADDALTTVLMALPAGRPVVLGPAMNTEMWNNPVVQRNLQWLDALGRYHIVAPAVKRLACGDFGPGGLADPAEILTACENLASPLVVRPPETG